MSAMNAISAEDDAGGGVRDRVLQAAVELFADQGYDATSVAQVIARAGVAKGGFYHHFASKEELLATVYGDLITDQLATLRRIRTAGAPPDEQLRAVITDLVVTTAANAQRALISVRELHKLGDERIAELRRARRRYHESVASLIRGAQRTGHFGDVASAEMVAFTIFGVINELPLWYRPSGRKRPQQIAAELADFVLAGLAPR